MLSLRVLQKTLIDFLDEDFLTEEEIAEIQALRASQDWEDWRNVRSNG